MMTPPKSKIFCAFALSAVFTLTLTSCGGGGSRTAVPVNPPMKTPAPANPPIADTRLADARAAALAAYEAAKQALDDVSANKAADMASYATATEKVAAAKAASDKARAATTLEAVRAAQAEAETAKTEAMRYARVVAQAEATRPTRPAPANPPVVDTRLADARAAALAAYEAAKQALDDVSANKAADMASYATATEKVAAAKAASDKARAATTLEAAQVAQAEAETAKTEAMRYARVVAQAEATRPTRPAPANPPVVDTRLADAKAAAMAAYDAAKKALDDVMANKDADMSAYDAAVAQVAAAKAASDQAAAAETAEAAQLAQRLAERAQAEAERYAGVVTAAHAAADLQAVKDAAKAAYAAYDAAKKALDDVMANKDADMASYDAAAREVANAKAASDEAQAASDKAQEAETLEAAQAARELAERAQAEAEKYAAMVRDAKMAADGMTQKAAVNKGALTMEKAIDRHKVASTPVSALGRSNTIQLLHIDHLNGKLEFMDGANQNIRRGELPAVLDNLIGGFTGQLHVRTTENRARGEIVREKRYFFSNIDRDSQGVESGDAVADPNYIAFGFWVKETEKDGVTSYNSVQSVTAVPSGSDIFLTNTELTTVEGEATYSGPAAGAYIHKTLRADGTLDTAAAGVFAADVNLTAKFGGDDVPPNRRFSLSGAITNFRLSGGEENAWNLRLEARNVKDNYTVYSGFTNGTTNGGGKAGKWSGEFFDDEDSQAARPNSNKVVPGYMMGKFKGYFLNGAVAGAYGAQKE